MFPLVLKERITYFKSLEHEAHIAKGFRNSVRIVLAQSYSFQEFAISKPIFNFRHLVIDGSKSLVRWDTQCGYARLTELNLRSCASLRRKSSKLGTFRLRS
jgi:hypothetical protein